MKKTLLSGIKPTGRPHIGNYLGAMKQFVDMQDDYDTHVMIANYHDLGSQDPKDLHANTLNVAIDHIAIGLDPEKVTLFRQADVPEHAELAWIFNSVVTVPYLQRAHAYKDAIANKKEPLMTLFSYPVLMASDILMYEADVVPVGADQKQHVEIARDIAQKFNNQYGETFKLPEHLILGEVGTISGVDGRKMSKSYGNTISLFATDEEIERAVMKISTDSKGVDEPKDTTDNLLYRFHTLFSKNELDEIKKGYEKGGLSYADSKKILIESLKRFIGPMRERREKIASDSSSVEKILENGAEKAQSKARLLMHDVRNKVGLD